MVERKRGLDSEQRAELWRRWREGQSFSEIARALQKVPGSVFGFLRATGGIAPAPRRRSAKALSAAEREELSRGLSAGESLRSIARQIGRAPSTVSREIKRNGGSSTYRAAAAEVRAWQEATRPKPCKLAQYPRLRALVAGRLSEDWSPEQIAGWLALEHPEDPNMNVSHETIYRSLFVQARGVLKRELQAHLRTRRTMRRSKKSTTAGQKRGQILEAVPICERPAEVEDRAIPGHWEGDLISGAKNSHVATLVERHSRFTILVKLEGKDSESVVGALTKQVSKLPTELRRSLTWDRGTEMAQHKTFTVATNVKVYFCDPQSPWQRGSNENTNGLLRQYFPKGTILSTYSQTELDAIARRLNERPRKTLGFLTPAAKLAEVLQ
jgi:IS30 family transposase